MTLKTQVNEAIANHQRLLSRECDLASERADLHRQQIAADADLGEQYRLTVKINHNFNRRMRVVFAMSEVEDRLCAMARRSDDALKYLESYYRSIGCLPTEG